MIIKTKSVIAGNHERPILIDTTHDSSKTGLPIIIFCHGYKGFKDWGAWNLMAQAFAKAGFYFVKFNFSHNGGIVEDPIDFPDLEAFGNNNYIKELDDLELVINWVCQSSAKNDRINTNNITLVGHSRGGGIVLIKAEEDSRIKHVISLAGVSDYKSRFVKNDDFKKWRQEGVMFVVNGRTKQEMPHYFQFYENFLENESRLTIKRAVSNLKIPYLIIHGTNDTSVSIEEAKNLHKWNLDSKLETIPGADHVFGAKHPWEEKDFPYHLEIAVNKITSFIK